MEWVGIFALAYLMRGASRVHTDFSAELLSRPAYVRSPSVNNVALAILLWWSRQPMGNVIVGVLWTFAFLVLLYWLLGFATSSVGIRLVILMLAPTIVLLTGLDLRRR